MERLIIQYAELIWIVLNLLHYYLRFLIARLYKNLADFDSEFEIKYDKKSFLKFLAWIGFGAVTLFAYRHAALQKVVTADEYSAWVGAFFFFVIGCLLRDILSMGNYFVYWREISKVTISFKASMILSSFEFFGYSTLMLLSFLISKNPFLLGGTIGLAFGGSWHIFELTRKKYSNPA
jgi:hypothetical protein